MCPSSDLLLLLLLLLLLHCESVVVHVGPERGAKVRSSLAYMRMPVPLQCSVV
jgi:hypothetical protein